MDGVGGLYGDSFEENPSVELAKFGVGEWS